MTLRLVALMSVVLLLCLAAFGLLVNHYQDQIMQEVARTASEVGRATLRTFEAKGSPQFVGNDVVAADGNHFFWQSSGEDEQARLHTVGVAGVAVKLDDEEAATVVEHFDDMQVRRRRIERKPTVESDGKTVTITCETLGEQPQADECLQITKEDAPGAIGQFFIRIEDVRAESDPAQGLVLKIPRFTPDLAEKQDTDTVLDLVRLDPDKPPLHAIMEEIRYPIPIEEYQALFDSIRDRSIFLFLGVFLVGMALSAGLASRFTRPVRRLDAALHRISEGDLDAEVRVRGKDEIARLGRAFNDMTRRLRANRERSREFTRREKLSALGRLAAGVAHDVRNPLHSIGLTLQHLRETGRPEGDERAMEFDKSLEIIREEILRLDRLVGNFLAFANGDRGECQEVDLRSLLIETVRLIKKESEWRRIDVELEVDDDVPAVAGDGEAIRSSILNLVLNSFEAMPEGGTLTLRLRHEGEEAVVEVADTGEGIAEKDREKVFEFAYTTRNAGHGLGLAMVHQTIVEEHGGRVTLDSTEHKGTRVRLALPVAPARREP